MIIKIFNLTALHLSKLYSDTKVKEKYCFIKDLLNIHSPYYSCNIWKNIRKIQQEQQNQIKTTKAKNLS